MKKLILLLLLSFTMAQADDFADILKKAKGQTVYFNAWGGSPLYNKYIQWAIDEFQKNSSIKVVHTKLNDTADAVNKIILDKQNQTENGAIDIIWINGDNFRKLKEKSLLYGPITKNLPNYQLVNAAKNPAIQFDFGTPTDGFSAPWGKAQFVFVANPKRVSTKPENTQELLQYVKKNPGRFTYPAIPDFTGMTFLKQVLLENSPNPEIFKQPVDKIANIDQETAGLWQYLDQLHPFMWQRGKAFVQNEAALLKLFADSELDFTFSFNVSVASNAIAQKIIPDNSLAYIFKTGTIGNYHYLVIPFNAKSKEGAMAFINFLLSPVAQARKQNPEFWGEPSILDMKTLQKDELALFQAIPKAKGQLNDEDLTRVISEPHPTLVGYLEREWRKRYGQ